MSSEMLRWLTILQMSAALTESVFRLYSFTGTRELLPSPMPLRIVCKLLLQLYMKSLERAISGLCTHSGDLRLHRGNELIDRPDLRRTRVIKHPLVVDSCWTSVVMQGLMQQLTNGSHSTCSSGRLFHSIKFPWSSLNHARWRYF